MKKLIPVFLLAIMIVGCGRSSEQTSARKVENPPDTAPTPEATAPAPEPSVPAPAVKSVSKDGWTTLVTGLKYKDKKVGTGEPVGSHARVTVQYKGWLDNGTVFDTSRKPGRTPFSFTVDNHEVIPGWEQGIKGMKKGGIRELTIPSNLGYGDQGQGEIPPKATLHFEIELLDVAK